MESAEGYIYCMSNPSMEGLYKIGETNNPEARRKELSSASGVPEPYIIEFAKKVIDYKAKEKAIHTFLGDFRYNKEFFKLSKEVIKNLFNILPGDEWKEEDIITLKEETPKPNKEDELKESIINSIAKDSIKINDSQSIKEKELKIIFKNIIQIEGIKTSEKKFYDIFKEWAGNNIRYLSKPTVYVEIKNTYISDNISELETKRPNNRQLKYSSFIKFKEDRIRRCPGENVSIKDIQRAYRNWFEESGNGMKMSAIDLEARLIEEYGEPRDKKTFNDTRVFFYDEDIKEYDASLV
jgi:hypothetical protein